MTDNDTPTTRPLTQKDHPELYDKVVQLRQQIQKDYPDEMLPNVEIVSYVDTPGDAQAVYRATIKDGVESEEVIQVSDALLKKLNVDEIIAVIAHEYGHDAKNHNYDNNALEEIIAKYAGKPNIDPKVVADEMRKHGEVQKQQEFEADQFAGAYVPSKDMAAALEKLRPKEGEENMLGSSFDMMGLNAHPDVQERINRLSGNQPTAPASEPETDSGFLVPIAPIQGKGKPVMER